MGLKKKTTLHFYSEFIFSLQSEKICFFFLLIGGSLLYNIVVVFAIH